jgi:hypothetical protein
LLKQGYPKNLDDVADSFERACSEFDEHPGLVRAMALSHLGREARSSRRGERLEAIRQALEQEVGDVSERELRQAEAVLASPQHARLHDAARGAAPSGAEIGEALGWAIRTLVARAREGGTLDR